MRTIHTKHTVLEKYYPEVKYTFDTATQTYTWISQTHPTIEELENLVISENIKEQENEVRTKRNKLLAETDWMANSDVTMSDAWRTYRQALRDITTDVNFPDIKKIIFPTKPSE